MFLFANMSVRDRLKAAFFNAEPSMGKLSTRSVKSLNEFGLNLFAQIAGSEQENVVLSPASVASAMSMVAAGCTAGEQAEKELTSVLKGGFGKPSVRNDDTVELKVANSAWLKEQVLDSYKKKVKSSYGADVMDMPTDANVVNKWVEDATNGEIKTLLDEVPKDALALLINAVFFKAAWTTKFDPSNTVDAPFYKDGGAEAGEVTKVKMMRLKKQKFNYTEVDVLGKPGERMRIVEIPYGKKDEYSAVALVPTGTVSAREIAGSLAGAGMTQWDTWMASLQNTKLDVLAMPRFKVEYGVESLKSPLRSMGINAVFDSSPSNPQFLAMSEFKNTYLEDVLHKATIECTEEGTVASAATAAIVMMRSLPMPGPTVVLDRPFLFGIRNKLSGALLFLAKIDYPREP